MASVGRSVGSVRAFPQHLIGIQFVPEVKHWRSGVRRIPRFDHCFTRVVLVLVLTLGILVSLLGGEQAPQVRPPRSCRQLHC